MIFSRKILRLKSIAVVGFLVLSIFVTNGMPVNADQNDPASNPDFQIVPKDCGNRGSVSGPTKDGGNLTDECGWSDLLLLISNIMKFIIFISVTIGVMAFCYAGFLYVTAFGESGKIEEAHSIFKNTIMGMIIILLAWLIVATILKTLEVREEFSILNFSGVETIQK